MFYLNNFLPFPRDNLILLQFQSSNKILLPQIILDNSPDLFLDPFPNPFLLLNFDL